MVQLLAGALVLAGLVLAGLALTVARRRQVLAGRPLAVLLVAAAWWGLAGAVELSVSDPQARVLWGDVKYVGIVLVPPAWLVFALLFTGRGRWVTRRTLALLAVEPVLLLSALAVPATHDLVRYLPASEVDEPFPVVATGPLFWVHAVYGYTLVLVATVVFVRSILRTTRVYRGLAVALVTAAVLPWTANLLFNLEVGVFALVDLTPFLFVVGGAVLVLGLVQGRLMALARVARDVVVADLPDGVLVVDAFDRVVEANRAARALLGRADLVGVPLAQVLPQEGAAAGDLTLTTGGGGRTVEVRRQPLLDRAGATAGEVLLLRDVSEQRAAERQVRDLLAERTMVASALQDALRPERLPEVPGLVVDARYRPAGRGRDIGGDFYELFPLHDGRWCAVLGDVAGKGAAAAAVTARVRFTLRALSARGAPTRTVLEAVNEALLHSGDAERFCTLAHLLLSRDGTGALDVDLLLAGHHQPLLRHGDGAVEPVGVPGTALGLVASPTWTSVRLRLLPGEALCLFTDGLTEARDEAGCELGVDRVADVLAAHDPVGADGPTALLDALETTARDWRGAGGAHRTDDVAVLVVGVAA